MSPLGFLDGRLRKRVRMVYPNVVFRPTMFSFLSSLNKILNSKGRQVAFFETNEIVDVGARTDARRSASPDASYDSIVAKDAARKNAEPLGISPNLQIIDRLATVILICVRAMFVLLAGTNVQGQPSAPPEILLMATAHCPSAHRERLRA